MNSNKADNLNKDINILFVRDCNNFDFERHINIFESKSDYKVSILQSDNISHEGLVFYEKNTVKTFSSKRTSFFQTIQEFFGIWQWILKSHFKKCVVLGQDDCRCNPLLEFCIQLCPVKSIYIQSPNGDIRCLRDNAAGIWSSLLKNVILFFGVLPFILLGMGSLLLYFLVYNRLKTARPYPLQTVLKKTDTGDKLRIAIVSKEFPPETTDLAVFAYEIVKGLHALGHQVHVITRGERESDQDSDGYWMHVVGPRHFLIFEYIKKAGFFETGFSLEHSFLISRRLAALEKKYKFHVVEFPETGAEGFFYYLMKSKSPFVVRFHIAEGFYHQLEAISYNPDRLWIRTMEKYWMLKAHAAIGTSKDIIKKYEFFYNLDLTGVPVIPYPMGSYIFRGEEKKCGEKTFKVFFVGQFELRKGPHILLKAIPKILAKCPQAEFVFAGPGREFQKYCEEITADLGISSNVNFVGEISRDQVIDHYCNAAICVYPSLWDNLPYSFLESMAMGCPVVASNVGGFKDIIENRVNGMLVDAGDPGSLADAVSEMLTDTELRKKIEINAPESIKSLCDTLRVAEKTIEIYRKVIS